MKTFLIKLAFILENYALRERIEILATSIALLLAVWYFLVYQPEMAWIAEKNQQIAKLKMEVAEAIKKRQVILTLASSESIKKLEEDYKNLQYQMSKLDKKKASYQLQYISKKEITEVLYAMLNNVEGVSIDKLTSIRPEITQPLTSTASKLPAKEEKKLPPPPLVTEVKDEQNHYLLQLRGNYFNIMFYLRSLEQLKWQLYWDKLNYTVTIYPEALVNIEFYTLSRAKTTLPVLEKKT